MNSLSVFENTETGLVRCSIYHCFDIAIESKVSSGFKAKIVFKQLDAISEAM